MLCSMPALCPDCAQVPAARARSKVRQAVDYTKRLSRSKDGGGWGRYSWKLLTFTIPHALYGKDIARGMELCRTGWRAVWKNGARPLNDEGDHRAALGYVARPKRGGGLSYKRIPDTAALWSIEVSGTVGAPHVHLHALYFGPYVHGSVKRGSGHISKIWAGAIGASGSAIPGHEWSAPGVERREDGSLYDPTGIAALDPDLRVIKGEWGSVSQQSAICEAAKYVSKGLSVSALKEEAGQRLSPDPISGSEAVALLEEAPEADRAHALTMAAGDAARLVVACNNQRAGGHRMGWSGWLCGFKWDKDLDKPSIVCQHCGVTPGFDVAAEVRVIGKTLEIRKPPRRLRAGGPVEAMGDRVTWANEWLDQHALQAPPSQRDLLELHDVARRRLQDKCRQRKLAA